MYACRPKLYQILGRAVYTHNAYQIIQILDLKMSQVLQVLIYCQWPENTVEGWVISLLYPVFKFLEYTLKKGKLRKSAMKNVLKFCSNGSSLEYTPGHLLFHDIYMRQTCVLKRFVLRETTDGHGQGSN